MDWWIVKQLRAMILEDLRDFVPQDYFESEVEKFYLHDGIKNSAHFSRELRWGYLAGSLGKRLFFESTTMSARKVSASEMLMHLGLLAAAEAAHGVSKQLSEDAKAKGLPDSNSGAVAEQLEGEHIPTLTNNLRGALEQYLRYLTPLEAEPFSALLKEPLSSHGIDDKSENEHPNVRLLIKRMDTLLANDDPAGVLHTSASIFETLAKNVVHDKAVQDQTLGAFFDRYRRESELPDEILNYIHATYKRRNTEPVAGHGSTKAPTYTMKEAKALVDLTKTFLRIEKRL